VFLEVKSAVSGEKIVFLEVKSAILEEKFCVLGGGKPQKCNFCNLQFSGSLRKIGHDF
jgi:hypothetical protein